MRTAILAGILVGLGSVGGLVYLRELQRGAEVEADARADAVETKDPSDASGDDDGTESAGRADADDPPPELALVLGSAALPLPSMPEVSKRLPMVGPNGKDRWGYPLKQPDEVALRTLLLEGRFDELEKHFSAYEKSQRKDHKFEYWPVRACAAFHVSHPRLVTALEAWREAKPDSYAATCAWGQHLEKKAWDARGNGAPGEIDAAKQAAFIKAIEEAQATYARALEINPKGLAAANQLILLARDLGLADDERLERLQTARHNCLRCTSPYEAYLEGLRTRWGGSPEVQEAYLKPRAGETAPSRIQSLAGFPHADRCQQLMAEQQFDAAILECRRAVKVGDYQEDLVDALRASGRLDKAAELAARVLEKKPSSVPAMEALFQDAQAREALDESAPLVLQMRRLAPSNPLWAERANSTLEALAVAAEAEIQEEQPRRAEKHVDLCLQINPDDRDCWALRGKIIAASPKGIDKLRKRVAANPDDFDAYRTLDSVLAKEADYAAITEAWDEFIERHPEHSRAFFERAAARRQLGDRDGTVADVEKACSLGLALACNQAEQIAG